MNLLTSFFSQKLNFETWFTSFQISFPKIIGILVSRTDVTDVEKKELLIQELVKLNEVLEDNTWYFKYKENQEVFENFKRVLVDIIWDSNEPQVNKNAQVYSSFLRAVEVKLKILFSLKLKQKDSFFQIFKKLKKSN